MILKERPEFLAGFQVNRAGIRTVFRAALAGKRISAGGKIDRERAGRNEIVFVVLVVRDGAGRSPILTRSVSEIETGWDNLAGLAVFDAQLGRRCGA